MYHTVFVIAIPESDRIPLGYDQKVSSLTDTLGHSFKVNLILFQRKKIGIQAIYLMLKYLLL